ncbi:hypothetical protein [Streptomyces botrytidirepellens]|uniref:hypothetical protein n=1 Tax=Streptomyces botrytidirepellens TaxID=2486417 RepID=UPI001614271C|nr:hypothetical protein [Streptomyces botrytidirepellens]
MWSFDITEARIYQVPAVDPQNGVGYSGTTTYAQGRIPWHAGIAHINAAGAVAVRLYLDRAGLPGATGGMPGRHNREHAEVELAAMGFTMYHGPVPPGVPGASWEAVMQQVDHTLQQLWPQVEAVASQIRTSSAVSGDRVRSILGDAASGIDLAELADASRRVPERAMCPAWADLGLGA